MKIAVTGGMGSGKSRVAVALSELLGAKYVSADIVCRDLLQVGNPGYQQLQKTFSSDFFLSDGSLNRPLLRDTIFTNTNKRKQLDSILHPLVRDILVESGLTAQTKGLDLVAEVPLLFETGWKSDFDCSIVVFADTDTCVARIMQRDSVSEKEAMDGIASQMSLEEKCQLGDRVIDNSASFDATLFALKQFVQEKENF
ncbi:MAG: dephospho-CoA kinase [Desulfocapsa sp.]|nr:dephospho-CoA kinase [Desulfocapsa sp.]